MQAILKGKHQRFWFWLQDIKSRLTGRDDNLEEMEKEMLHFYNLYLKKVDEVREIVNQYEGKQKSIRNKVKGYKKFDFKMPDIQIILPEAQQASTNILSE